MAIGMSIVKKHTLVSLRQLPLFVKNMVNFPKEQGRI